MKKFLVLFFFVIPIMGFGQIEKPIKKGNLIIGGTGTGNFNLIEDSRTDLIESKKFEINLNPNLSYFVFDNLALGISATTGLTLQKDNNGYSLGIGPEMKCYLNNGVFLKYNYSYLFGHSETSKSDMSVFKAGVGYAFFINSKVSLEPALLYKFSSQNIKSFERVIYGTTVPELSWYQKWSSLTFEIGFNIFL